MGTVIYACGCTITCQMDGKATPVAVCPCSEHGNFSTVKYSLRRLREALDEAHEQLPPGPVKAA